MSKRLCDQCNDEAVWQHRTYQVDACDECAWWMVGNLRTITDEWTEIPGTFGQVREFIPSRPEPAIEIMARHQEMFEALRHEPQVEAELESF